MFPIIFFNDIIFNFLIKNLFIYKHLSILIRLVKRYNNSNPSEESTNDKTPNTNNADEDKTHSTIKI